MSKHSELRNNPPQLIVKAGAREVVFSVIDSLNNVSYLTLKKNGMGDFSLSAKNAHVGLSISNFNLDVTDITWAADEEDWLSVVKMINQGFSVIEKVRSR